MPLLVPLIHGVFRQNPRPDATRAEQRSLQTQISSLEKSLPISRQRADNFKQLADNDNVPKDAYLQREQQKIDQEGQLATGKSRLLETLNSCGLHFFDKFL
mgnify:CR=1 FL=1